METVTIRGGLTDVGSSAFEGCTALRTVSFEGSTTYIGYAMFQNCTALTSVAFPSALKEINSYAFDGCKNLLSLHIGSDVTSIGSYAFNNIPALAVFCVQGSTADTVCTPLKNVSVFYSNEGVYTLTFVTAGGSETRGCLFRAGMLLSPPAVPTKAGYTFAGWFTDAALTKPWDFTTDKAPSAALTLYAAWATPDVRFASRTLTDGTVAITGYRGAEADVVIPGTLNGRTVTQLDVDAFGAGVETVDIPASVKTIAAGAFRNASQLTAITVNAGNTAFTARSGALYNRAVTALYAWPAGRTERIAAVPATVKRVHGWAFAGGQMAEITFGTALTRVDSGAFRQCSQLETMTLPDSVTTVSVDAFQGCPLSMHLYGPVGDGPAATAAAQAGIPYNRYLLTAYDGTTLLYVLPFEAGMALGELPAPSSREERFMGYQQEGATTLLSATTAMPRRDITIHTVWDAAYTTASVTGGVQLVKYLGTESRIWVPEKISGAQVVSIADGCFAKLTSFTLLGDAGSVGERFAAAKGYTFEPAVYTITFDTSGGTYLADRQRKRGVAIGAAAPKRDNHTLLGWDVDGDFWPADTLAAKAMPAADLTLRARWSKLDNAVPELDFTYAILNNGNCEITGLMPGVTELTIPAQVNGCSVTSLADFAFWGEQELTKLTLPSSLTTVGKGALAATGLESLTLPAGVTMLGEEFLADCVSLRSVELPTKAAILPECALRGCTSLRTLSIPSSFTVIGPSALEDCTQLKTLTLPSTLKTLSAWALRGCVSLTSVNLGSAVTSAAASAFDDCTALTAIKVSASNTTYAALNGWLMNKSLTKLIRIPQSCTTETLTLDARITTLGEGALRGCRMRTLVLPAALTGIGMEAAADCVSLTQVTTPAASSLRTIGARAFQGSTALQSITLPKGVTTVGADAFPRGITIKTDSAAVISYAKTNDLRCLTSTTIAATGVTLSKHSLTMSPGDSKKLTASIAPTNTTEKELYWQSSNMAVAVVDEMGLIQAVAPGSCTITVLGLGGWSDQATVTVQWRSETGSAIVLPTEYSIQPGTYGQISCSVQPVDAQDKNVTWTSSAPGVVQVMAGGVLYGVAEGTAVLTASLTAKPSITAVCTVRVEKLLSGIKLPAVLIRIETEAWLECGWLRCVDLRGNNALKSIGARAFKNCTALVAVYLPAQKITIDPSAFVGCTDLTLYGKAGSYAEQYAAANGIAFQAITP